MDADRFADLAYAIADDCNVHAELTRRKRSVMFRGDPDNEAKAVVLLKMGFDPQRARGG